MTLDNGYYTWTRGKDALLSYHFKAGEFECPCGCTDQRISKELIDRLEAVRVEYGSSISIHSGLRCAKHQAQLKAEGYETATGTSTHELGHAVDIAASDMSKLVPIVERHFKAVGTARTWLHCDLRDDKIRRWTYSS